MTREYFVNRTSYNPATKRTVYRSRCFNTESEAAMYYSETRSRAEGTARNIEGWTCDIQMVEHEGTTWRNLKCERVVAL